MTREVAIMQPTYMPWMGYFDLIDRVDVFILLDTVQLTRRSWQVRNRIAAPDGRETMLSLPVNKTASRDDLLICDAELSDDVPWKRKHLGAIQSCYSKADFGQYAINLWEELYAGATSRLVDFHHCALKRICADIGIQIRLLRASSLENSGHDRTERLISLTRAVDGEQYLSPMGSIKYLKDEKADARFQSNGFELAVCTYDHPEYSQARSPFMSHLSVTDLLAHIGPDRALDVIRSGRVEACALSDTASSPPD